MTFSSEDVSFRYTLQLNFAELKREKETALSDDEPLIYRHAKAPVPVCCHSDKSPVLHFSDAVLHFPSVPQPRNGEHNGWRKTDDEMFGLITRSLRGKCFC